MKNSINKHFKRESKIMLWFLFLPLILGIIAAFLLPFIQFHLDVDKCLDAGGAFNYATCECDFKQSHQYDENHQCY